MANRYKGIPNMDLIGKRVNLGLVPGKGFRKATATVESLHPSDPTLCRLSNGRTMPAAEVREACRR